MNIVFILVTLLILVSIALFVLWIRKRKEGRYKHIIFVIPVLLVLAYGCTYIPHKVVDIEPYQVSKITIFDGNSGYETEITDRADIEYIIDNLNDVTFQKGKPSVGYMGYSFRTTIIDQRGKAVKELTINSDDTIRYKGFFYSAVNQAIDYEYIDGLVRE